MTVIEDAPAAAPASSAPSSTAPTRYGLADVLGTGDHKVVGRLWIATALLQLLLVLAAAIYTSAFRVDTAGLADPPEWYAQIASFRVLAGAFMVLLPLTIGLATLVVPLQVGAATIAFARGAAAAFWAYLLGSVLVISAYAIDGGPFGDDTEGVRLFIISFGLVVLAEVVALICIATTVVTLRAPGLRLARTPLFSWSMLVASGVWLLTLPVLLAMAVLSYLDVRYGGAGGLFGGGATSVYRRLAWTIDQPSLYAFAIPILGYVATVVPVFARTRHFQHRYARNAIGTFGALAVGAWAIPGFGADSAPWLYELPWIFVSFAILLPLLGLLGMWAQTIRTGRIRIASPLLYGIAAATILLIGVAAGAVQSIERIETIVDGPGTPLFGTSWTSGVAGFVLVALGTALIGGLVLWAPKILGRSVAEGPARALPILLLVGAVTMSLPDLISGLFGQGLADVPGPVADNVDLIDVLNGISLLGLGLLSLAALGAIGLVLQALRSSELPGDDPWEGHTLEWATSSPPPAGNFASLPEITSEAPLYDARHQEASA
jgi:heme/copper-type cytochrome/quinol oxidase subunit 1